MKCISLEIIFFLNFCTLLYFEICYVSVKMWAFVLVQLASLSICKAL